MNESSVKLISTIHEMFSNTLNSGALGRSKKVAQSVVRNTFYKGGSTRGRNLAWGRIATYGGIGAGVGGVGGFATSDRGDGFGGAVLGASLGVLGGGVGLLDRGAMKSGMLRKEMRAGKAAWMGAVGDGNALRSAEKMAAAAKVKAAQRAAAIKNMLPRQ